MKVLTLKLNYNFVYIVVDPLTLDSVIIDPAWEFEAINSLLRTEKLRFKSILLTHHHEDHTSCVDDLCRSYQVPVYMGSTEVEFYGFGCPNLVSITNEEGFFSGTLWISPLVTPGHTAGGLSYRIGDNLFTGDTLFSEGCGYCGFYGGDAADMYLSLQRIKNLIHPETKIYPGHSFGDNPGKALWQLYENNIYLKIEDPENFVLFRNRKDQPDLVGFK